VRAMQLRKTFRMPQRRSVRCHAVEVCACAIRLHASPETALICGLLRRAGRYLTPKNERGGIVVDTRERVKGRSTASRSEGGGARQRFESNLPSFIVFRRIIESDSNHDRGAAGVAKTRAAACFERASGYEQRAAAYVDDGHMR